VKYRSKTAEGMIGKRRPKWAGGGENVPLDILGILSDWVAILEGRGVSGAGERGFSITFADHHD
jgi:hypothetical protein